MKQVTPRAATLAHDYRCPAVPDALRDVYTDRHSAGVKCVAFVGEEAILLASGSRDGDVRLWPTNPGAGREDGVIGDDDLDELAGCSDGDPGIAEERRRRQERQGGEEERGGELLVGSDGGVDTRSEGGRHGAPASGGEGGRKEDCETVAPVLALRAGAAGKDTVRVWDVASNRQGSLLASASGDGALRLWSLPTGDELLSAGACGKRTQRGTGSKR